MKFIGNFASWINPNWVNYLLTNDGTLRPSGGGNPDSEEFRIATSAGYDLTQTYWQHFDEKSCPLVITPPIDTDKHVMWWFIKMLPGKFMPMHRDPHVTDYEFKNCTRYWMPLQDYSPGHVFIYNKEFIVDYCAGDLWAYDDANEIHGSCNIGYTPRLTFQFTTYDTN
jgi:hypothetical protein